VTFVVCGLPTLGYPLALGGFMRHPWVAFLVVLATACGSDDDSSAGSGGQSGAAGAGGSAATGGTPSTGGTTSAGGTTATGGTTSAGGSTATGGTTSTGQPCDAACTGSALCDAGGKCVCAPGFESNGSECVASAITDPKTRTKADVCARYASEKLSGVTQWVKGSGGECDPGTVPHEGQLAALRYLNLYRWMLGVGPVQVAPKFAQAEQECTAILQFYFGHDPQPTAKCYTPDGAAACGASLIAGGFGLIGQVDGYAMETGQNLIHRRNVLSVGRAGVWFGATGGSSAMHYGGSYPALPTDPEYVAHPGPGFNVRNMVPSKWFVQKGTKDTPPLAARVYVASTNEEKPMKTEHHFNNFSSFAPDGWAPSNDVTYRVDLVDDAAAVFGTFESTFVTCP